VGVLGRQVMGSGRLALGPGRGCSWLGLARLVGRSGRDWRDCRDLETATGMLQPAVRGLVQGKDWRCCRELETGMVMPRPADRGLVKEHLQAQE